MLEIVFSESACGALKLAQRYGAGEYHGGAIGVIARNEDGSEPSREELDRLRSLPEDAYDFSIRRALAEVPREFREGRLISDILGKYALGISDGWLAMRIEAMVQSGELAVAREAEADRPYSRVLRRAGTQRQWRRKHSRRHCFYPFFAYSGNGSKLRRRMPFMWAMSVP